MTVRRLPITLCVALCVVLAGCAGLGWGEPTATAGNGSGSLDAHTRRATVVSVVDGDTLDVRYPNGTRERVRLLGVDTPEVRGGTNPAEFPGVPDTAAGRACLRTWADRASAFAAERLANRDVLLGVDPSADRRDRYGRLLAYVRTPDANDSFNYALLATGRARLYDTPFAERERYRAAADAARADGRGLWACARQSDAPFALLEVHADAAGDDRTDLNDEYLVFGNGGNETVSLEEWTVRDEAGHRYQFPAGATLAPGARLTLHTGSGTDTASDRYWGADGPVWNNGGDTVTVANASGAVVLERTYA